MENNQPKPAATIKHFGADYNFHDTFYGATDPDLLKTIDNYHRAGHKTLKKSGQGSIINLYVKVDKG